MTRRPILIHPDPRLKKVCTPVQTVDTSIQALAAEMFETMYEAPGIGLAAPQIGINLRLFVMDCAIKSEEEESEPPDPIVMINPEIVWSSDAVGTYEEGCLSIPDVYHHIERPEQVGIRFVDLNGVEQEQEFSGIRATCAQHELDHLDGKLFIDYLSPIKRTMITNKMKKLKKERARA